MICRLINLINQKMITRQFWLRNYPQKII